MSLSKSHSKALALAWKIGHRSSLEEIDLVSNGWDGHINFAKDSPM